ncbi:uncharacterized protein LOC116259842 [Nymphaea colorata]|nr:uncharacterized protein LOC116259842 [Nymphaea colorata]
MGTLFLKFQEFVKGLANGSTLGKDPRRLQFEADVNRLFLYTSYKSLGKNADEKDAEEIIQIAEKASVKDQQKQVQENIHIQIKTFQATLDDILRPDLLGGNDDCKSSPQKHGTPRPSGLSFALGGPVAQTHKPAVPATRPLNHLELSSSFKVQSGYTLELKPSEISHEDAGLGLFLSGSADIGSVVAFYPGVIYSPAYYRYIPGYPRIDAQNPYLISRYDGTVIDAQPWGAGGEGREVWTGMVPPELRGKHESLGADSASDRFWKILSKPLQGGIANGKDIVERRNPLAFGHYANHPSKGTAPNVMVCPYDFPMVEKNMRPYIPNISFGGKDNIQMKRFGSFWLKTGSSAEETTATGPVLRSLVLVSTRPICDEELLLNYRLSNAKRRPAWYSSVDEEEDKRRWG